MRCSPPGPLPSLWRGDIVGTPQPYDIDVTWDLGMYPACNIRQDRGIWETSGISSEERMIVLTLRDLLFTERLSALVVFFSKWKLVRRCVFSRS